MLWELSKPAKAEGKTVWLQHTDEPETWLSARQSKANRERWGNDDSTHQIRAEVGKMSNLSKAYYRSTYAGWIGAEGEKNPTNAVVGILKGSRVWQKGLDLAAAMTARMPSFSAYNLKRTQVWTNRGGTFNYNRFKNYKFNSMFRGSKRNRPTRGGTGRKILTLYVHVDDNGNVKAEEMIWTGIAVSALVDTLETAGIRCEVHCVLAGYRSWPSDEKHGGRFLAVGKVKAPDMPLDLERMLAWTGHPGVTRTALFRLIENHKKARCSGFGAACGSEEAHRMIVNHEIVRDGERYLFVERMHTREAALEWVQKQIQELGLAEDE